MSAKVPKFIITVILLCLSAFAFAQDKVTATSDTSFAISNCRKLLEMLYNVDYKAADMILWEYFIWNDEFMGDYYLDAYDYYMEEEVTDDLIREISYNLHYEGDENDKFGNFIAEADAERIFVSAYNKKRTVRFECNVSSDDKFYVYSIRVTKQE